MAFGAVWVPVTLLASSAQTLRNAMQRDLIGALGAVGAAQVRFLFGLPFAVLFLAGMLAATGLGAPRLTALNLAWTAFGAISQVIATAMMLAAMRTKSFVVAVAYTKTEAAQIALFGLVALNDPPTAALIAAIALATIGVALMAVRSRKELAGRLAVGGARAFLRHLLRLRRDRLPLGGDRRREPVEGPCPPRSFSSPALRSSRRRSGSISPSSTAPGRGRFSMPGVRRCLPASWARSPRNSGSSPSR